MYSITNLSMQKQAFSLNRLLQHFNSSEPFAILSASRSELYENDPDAPKGSYDRNVGAVPTERIKKEIEQGYYDPKTIKNPMIWDDDSGRLRKKREDEKVYEHGMKQQNNIRTETLENYLKKHWPGFMQLKGYWRGEFEDSFLILGISQEEAREISKWYHQYSYIWGYKGKWAEYNTKTNAIESHTDNDGTTYIHTGDGAQTNLPTDETGKPSVEQVPAFSAFKNKPFRFNTLTKDEYEQQSGLRMD